MKWSELGSLLLRDVSVIGTIIVQFIRLSGKKGDRENSLAACRADKEWIIHLVWWTMAGHEEWSANWILIGKSK